MNKNVIRKKKISKECWNLDYTFLKWLDVHLRQFLKDASKSIDLTYHKFTINGKEYTQEEAIRQIISDIEKLRFYSDRDDEYHILVDEILDIWKAIFHSMWW